MLLRSAIFSLVGLAVLLSVSPALAQDKPLKIAVVGTGRVLNEIEEAKEMNQKFEAERTVFLQQKTEKEQALQAINEQMKQLRPDSPQFQETSKTMSDKRIESEVWLQVTAQTMERSRKGKIKAVIDKIQACVSELASKKDIDLVITQLPEIPDNLEGVPVDRLVELLVRQRQVLYANPKIDLTSEVIATMNAKFKEKK